MKLNPDCIRSVLIYLEDQPLGKITDITEVISHLQDSYSSDDVRYTCLKLHEGGLIEAEVNRGNHCVPSFVNKVGDITYKGHEFLGNIGNHNNWSTIKNVASQVGTCSIQGLTTIATNVISQLILHQMGLA